MYSGGTLYEDKGRDCEDASTKQGAPKIASKPPEIRESGMENGFSLTALRRNQSCQQPDLGLVTARTVR